MRQSPLIKVMDGDLLVGLEIEEPATTTDSEAEGWEREIVRIFKEHQDLTVRLAVAVEYHQDCYEALLAVQLDLAAADKEIERLRKDNEELRKKSINN